MSFSARYRGRCLGCDRSIEVGDEIVLVDGKAVHLFCAEPERVERPREVCPKCFIEKPCACEDGQ